MSSLRRSILLVLITTLPFHLPIVVECRRDEGYSRICTTGRRETVAFDNQGRISLLGHRSLIVAPEGNFVDNANQSDTEGEGGRWLRYSTRTLDVSNTPLSPDGTSAALTWTRQTQQHQTDDGTFLPASMLTNDSQSLPPQILRACLCRPNPTFYGPNETVPDLYLCPMSTGYCGIPFPGNGPVVCLGLSVPEVISINAWRIALLWYLIMILVCCCTVHWNTSTDFCRSFFDPQWNQRNVDRILAQNASSPPPPQWNIWAWQQHRFEQNLLTQARMVVRYEDFARDQLRREQGLPPPLFEMKTKRYSKDCCTCTADDHSDDDDSIHQPSCTICFLPFEDGDLVGDLACPHMFHKACLKSWCTRKNACPLCNTILATRRRDPQPLDIPATNSSNNNTP